MHISPGAEVLNQLASMRQQLQQERARVENALEKQKVWSFHEMTLCYRLLWTLDVSSFSTRGYSYAVNDPRCIGSLVCNAPGLEFEARVPDRALLCYFILIKLGSW